MAEKKITRAEAVRLLDEMDTDDNDPEVWHSKADDILLAVAPTEVRDAYKRLVGRSPWWATA